MFTSLCTQLIKDLGAPSSFLYDSSVPATPSTPAPAAALATLTAATKTALQSPAFLALYRDQVLHVSNLLSAKLSESIPANAPPPLAKLLLPLSKVSDVLLPIDVGAARAVAEEFHNLHSAEEYIRKLFGLFEEVDTTLLKGVL